MTEAWCFSVEDQARDFLAAQYPPANPAWVNHQVIKSIGKYNGQNSHDIIHSLINDVYLVAQTPGISLDEAPQSLDQLHLPSYLEAITEIETRLGVIDRQFTVADQLDILIIAETGLAANNKQNLIEESIMLESYPHGESRDKRETSLLTAQLEESKRNWRIKEMTVFVETLRHNPTAVSAASEHQAPPDYRL